MKSTCFTLIMLSLCLFSLNAQISLGLKGGVNLAHQSLKDIDLDIDTDEINGYTFGALLEIPLGNVIALQPEFLLIQKGGDFNLQNIRTKINYIDIPILLKLKIINADLLNVNILGGPTFGYATNGEMESNNTTVDINFGADNIKRFDVGLNVGGGVGINLGSLGVFGDVRYLYGLTDLDEQDSRKINNKGITISGGLLFKLF